MLKQIRFMLYHDRERKNEEHANFVHIVYLLAKLCNIFDEAFLIDVSIHTVYKYIRIHGLKRPLSVTTTKSPTSYMNAKRLPKFNAYNFANIYLQKCYRVLECRHQSAQSRYLIPSTHC